MDKITWQRVLTLILMSVSLLNMYPYDAKVGELYYSFSGDEAIVDCYSHDSNIKPSYGACYQQTTYTIPSIVKYNGMDYTVREIGSCAFGGPGPAKYSDASPLKTINLPSTLQRIDNYAFQACGNLYKIIIPSEVEEFGYNPFSGCNMLRQIIYTSPLPPSNWVASSNTYVPSKEHYSNPPKTMNNARIIELITWEETEFIYSGQPPVDLKYICNLPEYSVSLEIPSLNSDVGHHKCDVNATFVGEDDSFTVIIPYEYNILPKTLNITVENATRLYGESNPDFKVLFDGFVNGENMSVLEVQPYASSSAGLKSNIGNYPITITGAKALNYSINYINGELTILPAPLLAKINPVSREYGYSNPTFTFTYEGLKNEEQSPAWIEEPIFNTTATITSDVGEYPVTATAVPKNYNLSQIYDGTLTILPAKLKVVAQNKSRLYYEENPSLTFYYSGFRNGETGSVVTTDPTLTTDATINSNVGEYEIAISSISAPNYEIIYQTGVLTILPRTLTVQTGQYERAYGESNPTFELQYSGFVASEEIEVLKTLPTAYTNATESSNVGTYPIYISGGDAINYSFQYNQGRLTIVKADQEIIWNQDLSNLSTGQQVELLAYSSSNLPISYTIDSNNVCELYSVGNKKYIDCVDEGEIQIRASQDGNGNYNPTPRVSKKIVISKSSMEKPILTIKQLPIGSISTSVDWGAMCSFTLSPEPNWEVNAISINGNDYTHKMDNNGTFTTPPITQSTSIIISYKDLNSGIDDVTIQSVKVLGCDGGIKVVGANDNAEIVVYTIEGYCIKTERGKEDELFIPLSNNQTYIVKVGGITTKVRI
ncbi:MAG: leucine-rich repeat protein [Muribaculum sp.]|nr:leucine-rich repeat protein [Muribaculum sp.]